MRGPAPADPAQRVGLALALLAIDPVGLGGLWLRARVGPVRAAVLGALGAFGARLHPGMDDATLLGGTDLAATLQAGRVVTHAGLLAGDRFALTMAERCPPGLAARLAQRLDAGGAALLALDEAAGPDEGLPPALADRLGLFVALDGLVWSDLPDLAPDPARLIAARAALPHVDSAGAVAPLTVAAAAMGIGSARAVLMALACARAAAAWRGARAVDEADLRAAAELVLAPRGLPPQDSAPPAPDQAPPPPPDPQDRPDSEADAQALDIPPELLVEAARAALPPGLIERLSAGRAARQAAGSGAGALRKALTRGRPLPARPGRPGGAARVDLIATLRQAAPWQPLRRRQTGRHLTILPGDIRLKRYQDRTDRVLILAVDASGSLAMTRLAEAKGAVERLLAEAYVSRDHVALVAFRGTGAELLLPPTRSLVQTKRRLAGLPGGGGTPLAAGLQTALETARQARARGLAPALAVLTDGRANVSLSGTGGRPQAMADSHAMARALAAEGVPALVIDTGMRPSPALAELARALGGDLVSLPRADDAGLAGALSVALTRAGGGAAMTDIPSWWPHRAASRRVRLVPNDWHVQVSGAGPDLLLLHGAGASGHSWRKLTPLLGGYRLIVPDLPGQGFTRSANRMRLGIDGMADDLAALVRSQGWHPVAVIGHSAGGALAFRLAEMLPHPPVVIVGINAALGSFEGFTGWLFPRLAKAMALSPMIAHVVAKVSANRPRVEKLMQSTGSKLDHEGIELYRQLLANPSHIDGTLGMMSQWDLEPLIARLGQTGPTVLLIAAEGDTAVPPQVSRRAAALIPRVEFTAVARYGHLVHEEAAGVVASLILPFLARQLHPPRAAMG